MQSMQLQGLGSSNAAKTPAEIALEKEVKSLNQQTKDIVQRNTVEGAIFGALAGCALAELTGGDCATGAIAGGVAGGIAGNQVGNKAANVNKELVDQRKVIANLSGINKKLGSVQTNLRSVVRSQNSEIASLRRQLANNQVSKSQYDARVKAINSNRSVIDASLKQTETRVSESRVELAKLEKEGGRPLTNSKKAATSTQKRLANLRKSVSLTAVN